MKYLVIESIDESTGLKFLHFIHLRKDCITSDILSFVNHIYWKKQKIINCFFSIGRLIIGNYE